jgi:ankyrin repeat protein
MIYELLRCTEWGDLEGVKQLVEGGANIEETNEYNMTALILASLQGPFEIVVYLVELEANVTHADHEGKTTLHWVCIVKNLSSVKCLLEHGTNVTERDDEGRAALLHAGSLEIVQYLLSSEGGASLNETDNEGNAALLLAARSYHPPMVIWLLEFGGPQITATDNHGASVWTVTEYCSLPRRLKFAYKKGDDGEYVSTDGVYVLNVKNGAK